MQTPERRDGYAPIEAYAALGDGRTVALVATDGAVDWLAIPSIDDPPAFAAILDNEKGGRLELEPTIPYTLRRRYRPDTPVLETTFVTESGTVTVVDSLNREGWHPLPWTELARAVHGDEGEVPMRWRVAPGRRLGDAEPWTITRGDAHLIRLGDQTLAVMTQDAGKPQVGAHDIAGEFTTKEGSTHLVALLAADGEPVLVPPAETVLDRVEHTSSNWRAWRRQIHYDGPHPDAVVRSALTLKLLTLAASGANAAAPTTSLPEVIGGDKNYDYRYTWVRDASYALDALSNLELINDVHSALSWLLDAVARTAPDVHPFYTLKGEPAPKAEEIRALSGYRNTSPVRVGNDAAGQRQLGAYGDLIDAVWRYVCHHGQLDPTTGSTLAELADRVCDLWRQEDAGIWELDTYHHYTSSKIGCWVAVDRAVRLAELGQLPDWHCDRWERARQEIRDWVDENCWSDKKRAYTAYAGSEKLDAAVLLAARTGFCDDARDRLDGTIDAVRRELSAGGPLLYRYSDAREKEGAFVACSFWLVEALAYGGRRDEAVEVFEAMLDHCNDVGLLSEEIDPDSGSFLGNFPQGLSHLALIGGATALARTA